LRLNRLNYPGQSAITSDRWCTRIGKNFHKPTIEGAPIQRKLVRAGGGRAAISATLRSPPLARS
jgi:hypothetical protein